MSEIDPGSLYPFLSEKTGLKFPLGNDILESARLSESQMHDVISDLGRHLGLLHQIQGENYGPLDLGELDKGRLVGTHGSLYQLILETYKERLKMIDEALRAEQTGKGPKTELSNENRRLMNELLSKRNLVMKILEQNRELFDSAQSRFLNGNIHFGSIAVRDGKFVGLIDFRQVSLGDPVNDLAYFSVMPRGEKVLPLVLKGWKEKIDDHQVDEKLHLYRLLEAYRKIIRRYAKWKYLQSYPEPLKIAQEELAYYNRR